MNYSFVVSREKAVPGRIGSMYLRLVKVTKNKGHGSWVVYYFSMDTVTNYHKSSGLAIQIYSLYSSEDEKSKIGLLGQNSSCQQGCISS